MQDIHGEDAYPYNLASFADLVDWSVSEDEELRVCETGWKATELSASVEHPLFFTDDSSFLGNGPNYTLRSHKPRRWMRSSEQTGDRKSQVCTAPRGVFVMRSP